MLKIEARSVCTRMRGCSSAPARNKSKQITSKLELGLNCAVNVDFWVCNDDFNKNNQRQKRDFCCFSMTLETAIFVLVQIQTLTFCKNRWSFCVYRVSKFEGLSSEWWQLIVKVMFAWLRKLQLFKAVEFCTGGYGQFRCQRVNQKNC